MIVHDCYGVTCVKFPFIFTSSSSSSSISPSGGRVSTGPAAGDSSSIPAMENCSRAAYQPVCLVNLKCTSIGGRANQYFNVLSWNYCIGPGLHKYWTQKVSIGPATIWGHSVKSYMCVGWRQKWLLAWLAKINCALCCTRGLTSVFRDWTKNDKNIYMLWR